MLLPGRETSPRLPTKVFDFAGPENQVRYKSEDGTELEAKIAAIRFGDREGDWSDIPCPVEGVSTNQSSNADQTETYSDMEGTHPPIAIAIAAQQAYPGGN
jgi:hypothetical protein